MVARTRPLFREAHEVQPTEDIPSNVIKTDTVSYTHLDVYKRQVTNGCRVFCCSDYFDLFRSFFSLSPSSSIIIPKYLYLLQTSISHVVFPSKPCRRYLHITCVYFRFPFIVYLCELFYHIVTTIARFVVFEQQKQNNWHQITSLFRILIKV